MKLASMEPTIPERCTLAAEQLIEKLFCAWDIAPKEMQDEMMMFAYRMQHQPWTMQSPKGKHAVSEMKQLMNDFIRPKDERMNEEFLTAVLNWEKCADEFVKFFAELEDDMED